MADGGHGGGNHPLRWTSPMSGFMLRRFVELIASGVKTDKGFKEVHINQVAKNCSDHFGLAITGTQVYNHLRKWRARWVKISKLRDISGSLWDDTNCVISLEEEHYLGHIKDHPKDVEYLNVPLENYVQMLAIFGTGIATGRYAMASNEALGAASMVGTSPSDVNIEGSGFEFVVDGNEPDSSATAAAHGEAAVAHSTGKRKRASLMSEEEVLVMTNMSEAVREVANAIKSTTEAHPELYDAVMELPGFSEDDLLIILDYLNESANRARSHSFVQMTETRRTRWVIHHLSKLKDDVPKGGV
uniref:Myb/SANT-like domain-containing protein n=1 Tax=Hordeum vulgare subsp. vulgare TaxID=112509 RepID=A0A8I6X289_HORVV